MESIFWIILAIVQFIVILYFIHVAISANKEIKEQSEIIEIRDHQIRSNIDMYNLALERELMLINELKKKEEETSK